MFVTTIVLADRLSVIPTELGLMIATDMITKTALAITPQSAEKPTQINLADIVWSSATRHTVL